MKLLLFTDNLGGGGAQRQLVGLAVMLKNKGYDVKVCTYYDIDFYKYYLDNNCVDNELIRNAVDPKKRIISIYNYLKKENPNCVIAYQETPSIVACICKILGCKYRLIVSERNTTQHIGLKEKIRFYLYRWANNIVPNSYSQEKFIIKHFPKLSSKVTTITNFVDLEMFIVSEHARCDIPEIMVAATIFKSKNTLNLIKAAKILKDSEVKFHISWYGYISAYQEYYDACQKLILEYNLKDYVVLLPKTKQIAEKYREADYFCLPSFYEGTPNVICEAISSGLPVLCSDICDNAIYVHEGENGFMFDPNSPESIASAMMRMLSLEEKLYVKFSKKSRIIAEEKLSKDVFLKKYQEIIERL